MSTYIDSIIPVGSYVTSYAGNGYFVGVTGSQYVLNIGGKQVGVDPSDVNITHVPGFMAEDNNGEIRYYLLESNANAWDRVESVVAALVPIGAHLSDVFESLEDFPTDNPAIAAIEHFTLWSQNRQAELIFASEAAAFSYSRDNGDCLVDADNNEVSCHHAEH
jgi:hypothetical protein